MTPPLYHHRRERRPAGRHAGLEMVVSAIVLVVVVVVLVVFVFIYHDIPLRVL